MFMVFWFFITFVVGFVLGFLVCVYSTERKKLTDPKNQGGDGG